MSKLKMEVVDFPSGDPLDDGYDPVDHSLDTVDRERRLVVERPKRRIRQTVFFALAFLAAAIAVKVALAG